ncbi:hypothetical protein B0J13DRAFT_528618 [Dactylonectria estremocensis]|uniref:Uncharacterized protein n=1 Tax=Dactylonectria estremocensis TaxID=1079267 RepID=A0A9P9EBR4_9HYPO|nr:hypothetical protein B0J13DRAFT_528618 [Dactylonectria estremocensis]
MAYPGLLTLLIIAFVARAHCNTTFTSPGPFKSSREPSQYPTYKVGQRIDVQWESSNATSFDLWLAISPQLLRVATDKARHLIRFLDQSKSYEFEWTGWSAEPRVLSEFFNVSAPDSSLSTGAVASIAVGSTIGGLLIVGGIAFLAWRSFRGLKGFRAWKDSQHVKTGQEVSQSQQESLPPQYRPLDAPHAQLAQHSPTAALGHNESERKSELPGANTLCGPEAQHTTQRHQEVFEAP